MSHFIKCEGKLIRVELKGEKIRWCFDKENAYIDSKPSKDYTILTVF